MFSSNINMISLKDTMLMQGFCSMQNIPKQIDMFCGKPLDDAYDALRSGAEDIYYSYDKDELMPVFWRETTIPAVGV